MYNVNPTFTKERFFFFVAIRTNPPFFTCKLYILIYTTIRATTTIHTCKIIVTLKVCTLIIITYQNYVYKTTNPSVLSIYIHETRPHTLHLLVTLKVTKKATYPTHPQQTNKRSERRSSDHRRRNSFVLSCTCERFPHTYIHTPSTERAENQQKSARACAYSKLRGKKKITSASELEAREKKGCGKDEWARDASARRYITWTVMASTMLQ